MSETTIEGSEPIDAEVMERLVNPLIEATCAVLQEMTDTEIAVRSACQKSAHHPLGDIAAVFRIRCKTEGCLVFSFPKEVAAIQADRLLKGFSTDPDETLIQDSVGEIANVIAGQAKALLAETAYPIVLSMPQAMVSVADFQPPPGLSCLVVIFQGDRCDFALQLYAQL